MPENIRELEKILSFYRTNNPEKTKDRMDITKALKNRQAVFSPALVGQVMNTAVLMEEIFLEDDEDYVIGEIEVLFNGRKAKSELIEVNLPMLAVAYSSAAVGEIFESGIAEKAKITLRTSESNEEVSYHFTKGADMYIPENPEGKNKSYYDSLYPMCLFSFYYKNVSTLEDWRNTEVA